MEFQRTPRFPFGRDGQHDKSKVQGQRAGSDPEGANADHDKETRHITLAYFDQKSTVDYIGVVQGIPVCFDAKECAVDLFTLQKIHPHQVQFMRDFDRQGGIAFFLIYFTARDVMYYMSIRELNVFWDRMENGGRKSFRFEELKDPYFMKHRGGQIVPYLDMIQLDLNDRENDNG